MGGTRKIECEHCQDELWVCEAHPDKPWNAKLPNGCDCGAGAPCPVCNENLERGHGLDHVLVSVDGKPGDKGWVQ